MIQGNDKQASCVEIPVPRQYRDYLTWKHNKRLVFAFVIYVGLVCIFYSLKWNTTTDLFHGIVFVTAIFEWIKQTRQKTWQYVIDQRHLHLVWWEGGSEKVWHWFNIEWRKDAVIGTAFDEWHGLPALRVTIDSKHVTCLIMVYSLEDEERVRTQILPLIEKYRHQYRQKVWADKMRS
jgi:hypothetical protein